ncbi:ATP-binding protein [Candidatus Soleaferrea massiliensis]|uniref:ATP-binding protein n=1 Tax=Candidatus Soleaferrea massiliensis TaxID=1470354 RepID=UPI00058CFD9D|nr:ATP-binding protein [Candidatus Soleaferrea massiliensis]
MKIKHWLQKSIPVLLTVLFCMFSILSLTTIIRMQGNARVVNYTGIVRGATQRLIKQEMKGSSNDKLIGYLDEILMELSTGEGENGLTALEDTQYQELVAQMHQSWKELKDEITRVRRGVDDQLLFELSESYFDLANRTVSAAEQYSETSVNRAKNTLICLCIGFAVIVVLFWIYSRRQKKVQAALDMARHASEAKSEFLSRMSHEIRTPLNGIIGMTEIAQMYPDDRGRVDGCLQKIGMSSKYLLALINDILDMSRIESGKIELEYRVFHLKDMLEQIYGMFQQKAEDSGVDLQVTCGGLASYTVIGDDTRLSQVLVNIVSNALKFTPPGGRVTLEVSQREANDHELSLEFLVTDTGVGISEEFQSRIFEPFEQETDRQYGGTGLGLAISSSFVKMMGGEISVNSRPGEGSRFTVRIRLRRPAQDADLQDTPQKEAKGNMYDLAPARVLLAEDNDINAEIVTVILEENGAHVKRACNGKEAAELFAASPEGYTLILMDIQMPVMGGLEASQMIRKMNALQAKTVPIIGLSANAFSEDIDKAMRSGMNGYLSKPVDMEKLLETVRRFHS